METITKEKGRIATGSMGCFLNPPTHPEYNFHVELLDLRRKKENRGSMSLRAALDSEWLNYSTKQDVKKLLDEWNAPDINSPEVKDWICQCLGYFGAGAGLKYIREWYPGYNASPDDLKNAYWGKKPSK